MEGGGKVYKQHDRTVYLFYMCTTTKVQLKLHRNLRRAHLSNCQLSKILRASIAVSTMRLVNKKKTLSFFFRIPIRYHPNVKELRPRRGKPGKEVQYTEKERGEGRNCVWWASVPSLSLSLRLFDGCEGIDGGGKKKRKKRVLRLLQAAEELFLYKSTSVNADEVCRKKWEKIFVC